MFEFPMAVVVFTQNRDTEMHIIENANDLADALFSEPFFCLHGSDTNTLTNWPDLFDASGRGIERGTLYPDDGYARGAVLGMLTERMLAVANSWDDVAIKSPSQLL